MITSRWSSRVCDDPTSPPRSSRRTAASLATATGLALLLAVAPAGAANNPGTGDPGFFTFRPSPAVGGTQINVASGNALIRTRDLDSSTANYNVVVDRAYNSLAPDTFSILSPRWAFDVGPTNGLTVEGNQDVTASGPSGYRIRFARQSDGSYTPPAGFDGSLTKTSSGWTLTRTSQGDQFGYDNNGKLAWTKDAAARDFTVQGTSAAGRDVLSSYGTSSGRRVNLSYTGDSLVREMDDPSSGHHYYRYTNGRLTQYESPSGAITTYRYDSNGRLDKITEPGGTTVELTTTAGGRVSSITTTLPGGAPQTTSFVYTRRPYKTDVTGPDGVRRTYAYDDDWRVTRQYNPDIKPTVTAAGELVDTDYSAGNQSAAVHLEASEPGGSGLAHLAVEELGGNELASTDPVCSDTPFDHVCPTAASADLAVDLSTLSEGAHVLRAVARDDEGNVGVSDTWTVTIDRTPPTFSADFEITANLDPATHAAIVDWDAAADHTLSDGSVPSGPGGGYRSRYRRPGGNFSEWVTTDLERVDIPNAAEGDTFELQIIPLDEAGNSGDTKTASVTVSGEGSHCQPTANGAPSDCFDDVTFADDAEELAPEPGVSVEDDSSSDATASGIAARSSARRTRVKVSPPGEWATIRRKNNSFVIGNARNGWQMDVVRRDYGSLGWVTGKVFGGFQDCGWVQSGHAPTTGNIVDTSCDGDFSPHGEEFADGLNCQTGGACHGTTPIGILKTVTDVDECLNVSPTPVGHFPTKCENKVDGRLTPAKIKAGYVVGWRYTTNGRSLPGGSRFVLISDPHVHNNRRGRWAFIPRRAFRSQLCTRNTIRKFQCGPPQD